MLKILASLFFGVSVTIAVGVAVEYYEPTQQNAVEETNNQSNAKALEVLSSERVAYYTKILSIFTGVLSAFGLLQIFFLVRADKTARLAANSAIEGNALTEKIFVAEHRPWVAIEAVILDKFQSKAGGISLDIKCILRNVGVSPAIGVYLAVRPIVMGIISINIDEEMLMFRKETSKTATDFRQSGGLVLFRDQPCPSGRAISVTREEIIQRVSTVGGANHITLLILVCADYISGFDGRAHQTMVAYYLRGVPVDVAEGSRWLPPPLDRFGIGDCAD